LFASDVVGEGRIRQLSAKSKKPTSSHNQALKKSSDKIIFNLYPFTYNSIQKDTKLQERFKKSQT